MSEEVRCPYCSSALAAEPKSRRREFICGTIQRNTAGWWSERSTECLRAYVDSMSPTDLAERVRDIADRQSPSDYYATMDEEDVAVLLAAAEALEQ